MLRAHMSPDALSGWKGGMKYNLEVMKHILKISISEPMQPHDCKPLQMVTLEVTHASTTLLYISISWNSSQRQWMLPYCTGYDLNTISVPVHLSWVWLTLLKAIKSQHEMSFINETNAKLKKNWWNEYNYKRYLTGFLASPVSWFWTQFLKRSSKNILNDTNMTRISFVTDNIEDLPFHWRNVLK